MPLVVFLFFVTAASGADNAGFRKQIQPFLARHCNTCHNAKAKVANLDLAQYTSADLLLRDQDVWEKAARKIKAGEMPPKPVAAPPKDQTERVLRWLAGEFARYDRKTRPDPGRVTARRLNRAEYNNTVRDLLGVDIRPADQFPVDDSGYGFDNIGDVLSISPALMEKYMAAAERVSKAAIAVPRTFKETSDRYRSDRVKQTGPPGSLEVKHTFPVEGDYDIRIAIAGRRPTAEENLEFIVYFDGEESLRSPALTPPNRPRILEKTLRPKQGPHSVRAILAGADGKAVSEDKGVLVEYIEVRGPRNPAPLQPPPSHQTILTCGEWPGKFDEDCLKQITADLTRRAFRRTATQSEIDNIFRYVKQAREDGESPEVALRYGIQALLVNPKFLFRIEEDAEAGAHLINEFELATRLSYFLWSSMPDEELFQLAARRQLRRSGVMENQVKRMIADPRFLRFIDNFAGQWLELRNLDEAKPAPEKFPGFDNDLRAAMKKETQLFFAYVASEDRSILDFLDSKYTFLNERLAKHYGIEGVSGSDFRKVELKTNQRGGLLTQASLLTVSSYPNRTSPVIRGKYLLENFLNAPPPPPPPNVPGLEEDAVGSKGTLRQQLEKHRTNAVCASCHNRMDVLGFGLENYDAIGMWRDTEGKFPIDASGELPGGRKFATPAEMKAMLLSNKDDFAQCLTEKMIIFALGRGLDKQDRSVIRQIVRGVAGDQYKFSRLVLEIVKSAPFQMRRSEGGKS